MHKQILGLLLTASAIWAQAPVKAENWRGAGPTPCKGSDGWYVICPAAPRTIAIRAGHLFDSKTGAMLTKQVVLLTGDRIDEVGPEGKVKIPAGAQIIDLSRETVLPGLIDAHTHMFNTRRRDGSTEKSMLIAAQNVKADLEAGFTSARDMSSHGNGYDDIAIRDAIKEGRIEGPRYQVSTRGIAWGARPVDPAKPDDPLGYALVRSVEDARAAVRDQVAHGADWIKLFPTGGYSFDDSGTPHFQMTYPMPVLQALIDEAHAEGRKTACHVFGGEGQKNSIIAGCDTIEHGFDLDQEQLNMMVAKHLYYDPTLMRYSEPSMDENDAKKTGGKYRMIPIFEHSVALAAKTKGLKIMVGSGVDGSTFVHGTQGLELVELVKRGGLTPLQALQGATVINAEAMGWLDRIGSLEKGKYADLIAVSGDPLADITEVERVKFVMQGGKLIRNDLSQAASK